MKKVPTGDGTPTKKVLSEHDHLPSLMKDNGDISIIQSHMIGIVFPTMTME